MSDHVEPPPPDARPPVIDLADPGADEEAVTGAKAANLARCAAAGLRTVPGFVLTTSGAALGLHDPAVAAALRHRWEAAGGNGTTFVVRSSSTIEDAGESSMAGQFTSVLDVTGWEPFLDAVEKVMASGLAVVDHGGEARPMAVLVQEQVDASMGGVLFGVDPVTGDHDHLAVEVVGGRPDDLVGGDVTAAHYVLTRRGAIVASTLASSAPPLTRALRRALARIALQGLSHFRCAQDMEWAVDRDGTLWVLQSRPVTAVADLSATVLLGPGPVAETFPDPLTELEQDLWIDPLREGLLRALRITGAASEEHLERSPVLTTVGGWAAVDLDLLGLTDRHRSFWDRFSPSGLVRHVGVAWRVGRTRVALPSLAAALAERVDEDLCAVGPLDDMGPADLADLVDRARVELATVHGAEVLCGMLLHHAEPTPPTGVVALAALARARAHGLDEGDIVAAHPVVLALSAPSTKGPTRLPPTSGPPPPATVDVDVDDLGARDALRLRTRWLQELTGRAAMTLGRGLVARGRLAGAEAVRHIRWAELRRMAFGGSAPDDLAARAAVAPGPPLPPAFRLVASGRVLAETRLGPATGTVVGQGAGGGRSIGTTCHRLPHQDGSWILVTGHLVPELAALLPRLAGLVAETGSPLSHLAILAREMGVPTVVEVADARHRFPPGQQVVLDGTTGTVDLVGDPSSAEGLSA